MSESVNTLVDGVAGKGLSTTAILIIVWLAIFVVALITELGTQGLTSIWICGGSLVALLVAIFHGPLWLQVALFVVVTVVLLVATRPLAIKHYNNRLIKTNAEDLVGQQAVVTATIQNIEEMGTVKLAGLDWSARSEDGSTIEKGATIEVLRIEGVKLIVKRV